MSTLEAVNATPDTAHSALPLVLDLDGTLLRTDSLMETLAAFLRANPLHVFLVAFWLLRGRPHLKRQLALKAKYDASSWPQNDDLIAYAEAQAAAGRTIVLATASDAHIADAMRERFAFISETLASNGSTSNLKSRAKAAAVSARFPEGFVYAGDSRADIDVWRAARGAVVAGRSQALAAAAAKHAPVEAQFCEPGPSIKVWIKALRLHQWAKNALVFIPLLLGGKALDIQAWVACITCFFAMGVLASSTYLINDLIDLESDRKHWSKQRRPLASGALPLSHALVATPLGLAGGLALGYWAGGVAGLSMLLAYLLVTLAYSFALKRAPILDAVTLGGLFTIRLGMGIVFAQVAPSAWLLIFSMFLFSSLSLAKRATEIGRMTAHGHLSTPGRGYVAADLPTVAGFGASGAVAAALVLVLYLIEEAFDKAFYGAPQLLWAVPIGLSLWLGRIWLLCGRGELEDDPVAFAVKDRISLLLAAAMAVIFVAAVIIPAS